MNSGVEATHQSDKRFDARVGFRAVAIVVLIAASVAGCTVMPRPLTASEQTRRTDADLHDIFANQAPVTAPVTLYQAMARALKYNLDRRVKLMEAAYAQHEFKLSEFDMLPQLVANVDSTGRNNVYGASSVSLLTGTQSLEPSTSQDRHLHTTGLTLVWNILDFGVSYVNAEQKANQVLIAQERRRRAVEDILQDVRVAYWRALAAQRSLKRIDPLMQAVDKGLANSRAIEQKGLSEPMQALKYQQTLLDTLFQLQTLRQTLVAAKAQLAALMNLPPDQEFTLADPEDTAALPATPQDLRGLERYALLHRPEVREEDYNTRISVEQSRKALLRLLPGIEVDYGPNYDSNSYLFNNHWRQYGMKVSWNLFNIFSAKPSLHAAHANEKLVRERRLAMNMAVMTQVHAAYLQARQAMRSYQVADQLASVDGRILDQVKARAQTDRAGRLDLIRSQLDAVIADLRRDAAYAYADNAVGMVFESIGADALPDQVDSVDINSLANAIKSTMQHWSEMKLPHVS